MKYSETNLLKLLNYENVKTASLLEKISSTLEMQYIEDDEIYTLGSKHFVLDINKKITIYFVEEKYKEDFLYVEFYLSAFYEKRLFLDFYCLLRYFLYFLQETKQKSGISNQSCDVTFGFCSCIRNFNYCCIERVPIKKGVYTYNIFNHRYEFHKNEKIFVNIPERIHNSLTLQTTKILNLGECYAPSFFTKETLKYFENIYRQLIEYKCQYKKFKIEVNKDRKIYIDGLYHKEISFLFKRGLSLTDCLKFIS